MAAATGFSSTAGDVVRWAAAHFLGDERILPDDAKRAMQHTQWDVEASGEYALGFQVADLGGRRVLGHGGGFPGFITHTWFDPVDRLAVSVLTNAIDGAAQTAATLAVRLVGLAQEGLDGARRTTGRSPTRPGSRVASRRCGARSTSSPSAAGSTGWRRPSTTRCRRVSGSPSSTTTRCGWSTGPATARPANRSSTSATPTARSSSVRGGSGSLALPDDDFRAAFGGRDRIRLGEAC